MLFFFFFQAEDGIRDLTVTGVQTCALPISNVQALRARGVDARLVVFNRYKLHPEADVDLHRSGGLLRQQAVQWRAFARLARQTDVFHFYFGLTLLPKSVQFPLLRTLDRKSTRLNSSHSQISYA